MTEAHLQEQIMELAALRGWMRCHIRPARTERGWRTPISGDVGLPDLILARTGTILALEIKGPKGLPTIEQLQWLRELGPHAALVRPCDWDWITTALTKGPIITAFDQPTLRHAGTEWAGPLADWANRFEVAA